MQDDLYMIDDFKEEYSNSRSFKTRVYSILTFQFLSAASYIGHLTYLHQDDFKLFHNNTLTLIAIIGQVLCMLIMLCRRSLTRSFVGNYIMLILQTGFQVYLFSLLMLIEAPIRIFSIFCILTTSFMGLTIYTLTTKQEIEVKKSIVYGANSCLLSLLISLFVISPNPLGDALYLISFSLVIMLAIVFVVIDCHITIDTRRMGITHQDAIFAALLIYVDPLLIISHTVKSIRWKRNLSK